MYIIILVKQYSRFGIVWYYISCLSRVNLLYYITINSVSLLIEHRANNID